MPSRATELKYLKRILSDNSARILAGSGMDFCHENFFYKYEDERILFAEIDVSGAFRGEHWKSLCCTLHVYYRDFPGLGPPPVHVSGRAIPTYRQSRLRFGQERQLDQTSIIEALDNSTLKFDRNFWHVIDDESNVSEVLDDIAKVIRAKGLPNAAKDAYSRQAMLEREQAVRKVR